MFFFFFYYQYSDINEFYSLRRHATWVIMSMSQCTLFRHYRHPQQQQQKQDMSSPLE